MSIMTDEERALEIVAELGFDPEREDTMLLRISQSYAAIRADEREKCVMVALDVGQSYGEDEVGYFECSETIAASIRFPPKE